VDVPLRAPRCRPEQFEDVLGWQVEPLDQDAFGLLDDDPGREADP
jgi:hypothetical protein